MGHAMDVETRGDLEIIVTRRFDAPARLVFAAHEKPELVKRWMYGPDGWNWETCEIDFRPGGRFDYAWKHGDGRILRIGGEFREIVRPSRIRMIERMEGSSQAAVTTVTFRETAGVTTMVMAQVYASKETRDMMARTMPRGLEAGYARLDVVFAEVGDAV
ncbi:MAG: SRPBCC domain-containing protein [Alphaproteobacteria bacterium]|nr:SRPBCC domain-containing protein [Alphaproteobacteria bacterium]MBL6936639.1 SRPBCC domain-containing protein [Alphaproteobacteria bacterium]MBL7097408.1 SRPBCC domain-containing protein [Alphaproteobacteria bacterium]